MGTSAKEALCFEKSSPQDDHCKHMHPLVHAEVLSIGPLLGQLSNDNTTPLCTLVSLKQWCWVPTCLIP